MSPRRILLVVAFTCSITAAMAGEIITRPFDSLESEYNDNSNNTPKTAGPLLWGGLYPPSYFWPNDVDYYRLDVSDVPSTLTARVEGVSSVVISGDPEVWLESTTGTILAHSDDIAPGADLDCFFRYVFTTPGDYYVRVQHSSKSQWYYNYSNY